ncbi:MAG: pilus assembly protein PilM [Nitrospirae bacterium]|nr:pilus assembly protein PilM [Nitrospirota bacterium]
MKKVVGLDIGTHSVKAVLIKETFRGIDLGGYYEKPVLEEGPEHLASQIRSLFKDNHLRPDSVVAALPGNRLSIHHLTLPFTDVRKISRILPFEIEPLIPFPVEEVIVDHFPMERTNGSGPNGGQQVCTGIVRKEDLQQRLQLLREAAVDAKIIDADAIALFYAFAHFFKESPETPVALIDVGASKTNLCIVSGGKPKAIRTFGWGGQAVTRLIQANLGLPFQEAEEKKLAYEGPQPGESESEKIADAVHRFVDSLSNGLFQTLHAYESTTGEPVPLLYVTGGGARVAGLPEALSHDLQREVKHWKIAHPLVPGLGPQPKVQDLAIPGLGLALKGLRKEREIGFNFRKDTFFARKEVLEVRGQLVRFVILLGLAGLLGAVDFYTRFQDREAHYREIKQEIRKTYLATFPGSQNIMDENQQMKTAVADLRKKVSALGGSVSEEISPLDLVKAITEKLPPDLHLEIQDFMVDRGKVRIQGITDSFDAADRIKKELEGIPSFRKVEINDAKLSADQKRINFRISSEF